jgi:hypothetical protein
LTPRADGRRRRRQPNERENNSREPGERAGQSRNPESDSAQRAFDQRRANNSVYHGKNPNRSLVRAESGRFSPNKAVDNATLFRARREASRYLSVREATRRPLPRLLQEALRFSRATQEGSAQWEGEGREVAFAAGHNRIEGRAPNGSDPRSSWRGESASDERLFLRTPEQGEIRPAGETDNGEVGRLATFDNCLDDLQRQKSEPKQFSFQNRPRKWFRSE